MRHFLLITKALSDETRVRLLLALRDGDLCLCQIIDLLGLAPSTVSKHVDTLRQAGLVEMRKDGRWHFYRLASEDRLSVVREALHWALRSLQDEKIILADAARLRYLREQDPGELTACYSRNANQSE